MSTLSVFVDESGDFGEYNARAPYYIVSLVFHNQQNCIDEHIRVLNEHLERIGFKEHRIHTGPLVRREGVYKQIDIKTRKRLFYAIFNFARKCPITYSVIFVNKRECDENVEISKCISKSISFLLESAYELIAYFDDVIVYYDNGQVELSRVIESAVKKVSHKFQIKQIKPEECKRYKLSQVADLICTVEMIDKKTKTIGLSKSETYFFGNGNEFRKNYLKPLREKQRT